MEMPRDGSETGRFCKMISTQELITKTHGIDHNPSQVNPNSTWVNSRGSWTTNIVLIACIRIVASTIPGISTELAWTITNVLYLVGHFIAFHMITGTPFGDSNQGEYDGLTLWEQMDEGVQFTPSKKFLTALPIGMFLISTHYTHYDATLFLVNFLPLVIVLIAKLPALYRVRFFGINKVE